ncbi:VOC family protein [Streptomyces sp. NPDC086554]|uniref:VOC family protein n=1 Tax=Streptomyces sp. NPDC086554 TaxID=3154864 RepID=UPI0034169D14
MPKRSAGSAVMNARAGGGWSLPQVLGFGRTGGPPSRRSRTCHSPAPLTGRVPHRTSPRMLSQGVSVQSPGQSRRVVFGGPQDAELERLLALGARPADVGQTGNESWHVLADPEGNEFCLLRRRIKPV